MKKKFYLFTVLSILFCSSCTDKKVPSGLIGININPLQVENAYDIAADVEFACDIIALETNDNSLVGNVDRLAYSNGNYYIFDGHNNSVLIFDKVGNFIKKLHKKGQGPDEYTNISAFALQGENIWVADNSARLMLCYDSNLEMKTKINTMDITCIDDMVAVENHLFLATNWWGWKAKNWAFGFLNTDDNQPNCLLQVAKLDDNYSAPQKSSQIARLDSSCLFIQSYCDTIFYADNHSFYPAYQLYFTKKYKDVPLKMEQLINPVNDNAIRGIQDIKQTAKSILLGYADMYEGNVRFMTAIYNKESQKSYVCPYLINSNLGGIEIWQYITFFNNGEILTAYDPDYLVSFYTEERIASIQNDFDRVRIQSVISKLTDYSNPIIFRFKLKADSKL
jgi:hypothetical protein